MGFDQREQELEERRIRLEQAEAEIARRELELKKKESAKKQILLRLAPSLWNEIAAMAEEDIRSINGEIEYLLTEAVKRRKK